MNCAPSSSTLVSHFYYLLKMIVILSSGTSIIQKGSKVINTSLSKFTDSGFHCLNFSVPQRFLRAAIPDE